MKFLCLLNILLRTVFFWVDNLPNVNAIRDHLQDEGKLTKDQITRISERVTEILVEEENVVLIDAPLTICGDLHGQFYDLIKLFEIGGDPKDTTYLFLGEYVDRGNYSIEVLTLLYCYKILYPSTFFLLRGNHECRHLTDYFTFKEECNHKHDEEVYDCIMESFDALPISAVVNKQFFCVHGGLSPQLHSLDDITAINRFCEPPQSGPLCDLLWSDPMEDFGPDISENHFEYNKMRGCSFNYSYEAVCKFLNDNNMLSMIRAHEVQDAGYSMQRKVEKTGFPSVITLFSAPNYCESYKNKAAIMRYENNVINIRQFNHTTPPYCLPGYMNVFSWSLPFVAEKIGEILLSIYKLVDDAQADVEAKYELEKKQREEQLRAKIKTVSRVLRMYQSLRKNREISMQMGHIRQKGGVSPEATNNLTEDEVKQSLSTFEGTRNLDLPYEARPPGERELGSTPKNRPMLQRKVSLEQILREEPPRPPPTIFADGQDVEQQAN